MIHLILLLLIFLFYLFFGIKELSASQFKSPFFFAFLSGIIPYIYSFYSLLMKHNLKFYFFIMRISNRIKNPTIKWNINVRYNGKINENIIQSLETEVFNEQNLNLSVKIMNKTNQSINVVVNETLNLYINYVNSSFCNTEKDEVIVNFPTFEISCNNSQKKLNKEIIPLINKIKSLIQPESSSYTLNIDFIRKNPFYTVFIDHLRLDQIDDFSVNLNLDTYSIDDKKDRVSINKNKIHIITDTTNNLKELAKDFIFLSPDLSKLLQCKGEH